MGLFEEQGSWPGVLGRLFSGHDLSSDLASAVFDEILDGGPLVTLYDLGNSYS